MSDLGIFMFGILVSLLCLFFLLFTVIELRRLGREAGTAKTPVKDRTKKTMSRIIRLIGFSLIVSSALPGAEGRSPAQQFSLDEYKWINRLIILAAPASTDERLVMQWGLLYSEAEGLEDRDLRILELIAEDEGRFGHQRVNRESARETRKALDLPGDNFQILLIGKDGSVKLRSSAPLEASALFSVIDSMPMRQREMRESRQSQD